MHELFAAFAFYTVLPVGHLPLRFERIARFLPVVGLVVGLALAGLHTLLGAHVPASIAALLVVLAWLGITGGLHFDGLLDTADGWAAPPERRLAAMADSGVGAYAVIVGYAVLAAKTLALAELGAQAAAALVLAAVTARWGQVIAIGSYPYLRPTGKGHFHKQYMRWPTDGLAATAQCLAICAGVVLFGAPGAIVIRAGLGGAVAALVAGWVLARRFSGHTGDTYGAIVELAEATALVLCTPGSF